MEQRYRTVDTRQLLDSYRTLLPEVDTLPVLVSGNSMSPFLIHNRDTVYITAVRRPLRVGDIVLYQRDSGAYVLHRICKMGQNSCDIVGDAQTEVERNVRLDQIFAVVVWAERKGKKQAPGSFWWEFFEQLWVRMIPLRPVLRRGYGAVGRLFGR